MELLVSKYEIRPRSGLRYTKYETNLAKEEVASLVYHDIFDYPLTLSELVKWRARKSAVNYKLSAINYKDGFYFLRGRQALIYKRLLNQHASAKKFEIAKKAAKILSFFPSIKMVGVTGALAMRNAPPFGDVDLIVITKKGSLWTTRLLVYLVLRIAKHEVRTPGEKDQRDKLCLNMWLDESYLVWRKKRNIYTSHEIAQIVPLVNKDKTYEKFILKNKWVFDWWPNSVKIKGLNNQVTNQDSSLLSYFLVPVEKIAFWLQHLYMRRKITKETITQTRAIFHPNDWGKVVLSRLAIDKTPNDK